MNTRLPNASDCQSCGACCVVTDANEEDGYAWVKSGDYVKMPHPRRNLLVVLEHHEGFPPQYYMRTRTNAQGQRVCIALSGEVGESTRCNIYSIRPNVCAGFRPGNHVCLYSRGRAGLPISIAIKRRLPVAVS